MAMDPVASMHGPTLARDDRFAPPRHILGPLAAEQARRGSCLTSGALDAGVVFKKPAADRVRRPTNILSSTGSKRPRRDSSPENAVSNEKEREEQEKSLNTALKRVHAGGMTADSYMEGRSLKLRAQVRLQPVTRHDITLSLEFQCGCNAVQFWKAPRNDV
jgi:hypothetical protein